MTGIFQVRHKSIKCNDAVVVLLVMVTVMEVKVVMINLGSGMMDTGIAKDCSGITTTTNIIIKK